MKRRGDGGTWGTQWFEYDTVGNLTTIKNNNASGAVQRTYNNSSQRSASNCSVGYLNPAHAAVARTEFPANSTTHYCYDSVGNMVERDKGSVEEWLLYDMENRLTNHWNSSGTINATFAYNGDGARVRSTINGVTTLYAGAIEYEIDGSTTTLTKHYDAGGQRVAVRNGASLNYLLNDHLGSTSIILKTNGALWGELRYSAWGETRYSNGSIVTDRQFTGQINDGDTGLYYYNARYYDPALHKFIQADTIVPDPSNPQTLNRFSYTNNNPVKYTDPTGHYADQGEGGGTSCTAYTCATTTNPLLTDEAAAVVVKTIETAPKVYDAGVMVTRSVCEPCDMVATVYSWTQGDFHPADLTAFGTPLNGISARTGVGIIADGGEALARNTDNVDNYVRIPNNRNQPYPQHLDPRTGNSVPFPTSASQRVPRSERVSWGASERGAFIKDWYDRGYQTPEGGWENYDIHHIQPREFGGTNDFWNLVPVERTFHQTQFTAWWNSYDP